MNKNILYFALGLVTGAGAGATASYFITKNILDARHEEDLEAYAEHCEERVARIRSFTKIMEKAEEPEERHSNDPEEEKIAKNEGVKKYHHDNGLSSKYGENHVFEKIADKPEKEKDSKLISDIDEDEFMNQENGYEKQTIDVFLGDDKYMCGVWGYGTDNEDDVDRKWGKPLEDLIGRSHTYEELLTYCNKHEDGIGLAFIKNEELKIDLELVIHDDREDDK